MQLWYCILHAYAAVDETQKKQARLKAVRLPFHCWSTTVQWFMATK